MTNQILSRSSSENPRNAISPTIKQSLGTKSEDNQMKQVRKSYQAVQQVKYLHLQAEIDVLLQQLQTLKQN
ncbi:aspartate kinase [Crocosphaera sp. UHCC 0190]|uniref:aspartate kinase n=1 Tax=Crocosphaera sp. UHCC 0190 TaxID=3110246 RepID=UPI002B1F1586|nr:aspartate kinase [Crocosphaera sp. UHCC 0190]MEA5510289.1 aspartate kinase [Crocosphaera sp. UHCC 0190]